MIDGEDISEVKQPSLRGKLGCAPQNVTLYNGSLRQNIAIGSPNASDHQALAAAEQARLGDFIASASDKAGNAGLDANLGEGGATPSGGERQRICIARALVKKAEILLFDEATAALDAQTASLIQDNSIWMSGCQTVITVTHRLSTLVSMGKILVIDNGRIAQSGAHRELIMQSGLYSELWKLQSEGAST